MECGVEFILLIFFASIFIRDMINIEIFQQFSFLEVSLRDFDMRLMLVNEFVPLSSIFGGIVCERFELILLLMFVEFTYETIYFWTFIF
jgi:hypothetical protein